MLMGIEDQKEGLLGNRAKMGTELQIILYKTEYGFKRLGKGQLLQMMQES